MVSLSCFFCFFLREFKEKFAWMLRMKNVHKRYMWDDETKKKRNKISSWGDRNVNVKDGGDLMKKKKINK
jgi:hypothetical protein